MRRVYAYIREARVAKQAVQQLVREGVDVRRIHLFAVDPDKLRPLPVQVSRLRRPFSTIWPGGLAGLLAGVLVVTLIALLAGPLGWVPGIVIAVLCTVVGALGGRLFLARPMDLEALAVARRQGGLKGGETVMLMDLKDAQAPEVERRLKQQHPEIAVLGTDPSGTPPFP
jgi:hypothetical protein